MSRPQIQFGIHRRDRRIEHCQLVMHNHMTVTRGLQDDVGVPSRHQIQALVCGGLDAVEVKGQTTLHHDSPELRRV